MKSMTAMRQFDLFGCIACTKAEYHLCRDDKAELQGLRG